MEAARGLEGWELSRSSEGGGAGGSPHAARFGEAIVVRLAPQESGAYATFESASRAGPWNLGRN